MVVKVSPFKLLIQRVESMSVRVWIALSSQSHFIKRSKWMMCLCEPVWGRAGRWMWSDTNSQWALTHCWRAQEPHVHTCLQTVLIVALLHTGQCCVILSNSPISCACLVLIITTVSQTEGPSQHTGGRRGCRHLHLVRGKRWKDKLMPWKA